MTKDDIIEAMRNTFQYKDHCMIKHGESVKYYYDALLEHFEEWDIQFSFPDYIYDLYEETKDKLLPIEIVHEYQIYHDCGKPFSKVVDENGRVHYPDHARVSSNLWRQAGGNEIACALIFMDMDFHTLRGDDLMTLWRHPYAPTLYFTALAELYANFELLNSTNPDGFKIKQKRLMSAAKKYFK